MQRLRLELYSKSDYSEKAAVNAKVAVTTATVRTTTTAAFALISTDTRPIQPVQQLHLLSSTATLICYLFVFCLVSCCILLQIVIGCF
jgi:hypothetical protein